MKKTLILFLIFALSSALLLSACAPDEPETLYGKPKLSQLPDEEILKLTGELKLSETYDEEDISRIKYEVAILEDDIKHFGAYSLPFYHDIDILFAYYYDYEQEWCSQYIK